MPTIKGHAYSETLDHLDGVTDASDGIWGYGGNDTIFGLGGNDSITGGSGADDIYGGEGADVSSYTDSTEAVFVSLITGKGSGGYAEGDTLHSIEQLYGSAYDDVLIGNDDVNGLSGFSGDDLLIGGGGDDVLFGDGVNNVSIGDDTLKGGGGADTLNGGKGSDTASYEGSAAGVFVSLYSDQAAGGDAEGDELNDIENLTGSSHHDDLWGDDGMNVLKGMDGADTLKGFGGSDTIYGGNQNDKLYGMMGADFLYGENGHDTIDGGAGGDFMVGGLGNDSYFVDAIFDTVIELGGQGNDTVFSTANTYTLPDNVETLSLAGSLLGFNATGNGQSNTIFGNANDNVLNGGAGSDALSGLGGNDTFLFVAGQAQGDVVYEFQGNGVGAGDVIKFQGYGTLAQGATFHQLSATHWQVTSADGLIQETIVFDGAYTFDTTTDLIFV